MGGKNPIVLVADDDPALRMLCRVNLQIDGYQVVEAESAREVEDAIAAHDVAVVLLDVHLGRDDGAALAASLRERYPELPIAFFTGSVTGPVGEGVVDGRLSKPFTLEQLADVVRALVPGRPAPQT
jgi:two-component system, NtrC family, response regulator GlrR